MARSFDASVDALILELAIVAVAIFETAEEIALGRIFEAGTEPVAVEIVAGGEAGRRRNAIIVQLDASVGVARLDIAEQGRVERDTGARTDIVGTPRQDASGAFHGL